MHGCGLQRWGTSSTTKKLKTPPYDLLSPKVWGQDQ